MTQHGYISNSWYSSFYQWIIQLHHHRSHGLDLVCFFKYNNVSTSAYFIIVCKISWLCWVSQLLSVSSMRLDAFFVVFCFLCHCTTLSYVPSDTSCLSLNISLIFCLSSLIFSYYLLTRPTIFIRTNSLKCNSTCFTSFLYLTSEYVCSFSYWRLNYSFFMSALSKWYIACSLPRLWSTHPLKHFTSYIHITHLHFISSL